MLPAVLTATATGSVDDLVGEADGCSRSFDQRASGRTCYGLRSEGPSTAVRHPVTRW
ncbi:MAG: hypothetical protein ACRDQH_05615 [Pseudonocardiaceae bacterium]